jgi:lipopolysaccharide transport system permease protein
LGLKFVCIVGQIENFFATLRQNSAADLFFFSRRDGELMASVTAPPPVAAPLALPAGAPAVVRIEPPRGLFELRLRELWEYRELLYFFVWRDVKVRYKQTVIGVAWVILQPLMTMGVFTIFFGRLAKLPSQGLPYPVFYFAALVPWTYFATALSGCTAIVVSNQHVITKVYFPRLILPLAAVCSGLVDFAIGFMVMIALTLAYGFRPTGAALLLPLLILLALLTALGIGLWTSALNALYRDVASIIPFVVQFWLLASPVAYPSSLVPERWRWLYGLNPMAGVIEGFRWALTGHGQAPGLLMLASAGMVAVVLVGGLLFFQRIEGTIADRV